jgi:hypothetical protein
LLFTFFLPAAAVDKEILFAQNGGMENTKALLPRLAALARWLAFMIITVASALIAWKVVGIWQGTLGLFPEFDNAIVGISSPWNPFFTFLLTCFICVLGAVPMLRDRRHLGIPRLVSELAYLILSLYLLYAISQVVFASFSSEL